MAMKSPSFSEEDTKSEQRPKLLVRVYTLLIHDVKCDMNRQCKTQKPTSSAATQKEDETKIIDIDSSDEDASVGHKAPEMLALSQWSSTRHRNLRVVKFLRENQLIAVSKIREIGDCDVDSCDLHDEEGTTKLTHVVCKLKVMNKFGKVSPCNYVVRGYCEPHQIVDHLIRKKTHVHSWADIQDMARKV